MKHRYTQWGSLVLGSLMVLALAGCANSRQARRAEPGNGVDMGLSKLMDEQNGQGKAIGLPDADALPGPARDDEELAAMLAREAEALDAAYQATDTNSLSTQASRHLQGNDHLPETNQTSAQATDVSGAADEPSVSVSLMSMQGRAHDSTDEHLHEQHPGAGVAPASLALEDESASATPSRIDDLFAQLDAAMGQELASSSEPFRAAVAKVALAAAQGRDPAHALLPESAAAQQLSPAERQSVMAVAQLLSSLLSPDTATAAQRTKVLDRLTEQLGQNLGVTIPRAVLCTQVDGFGKYQPFSSTNFLAGQSIRALVYVEVDHFKHRPIDNSSLGGLKSQDHWSVEISEELKLLHKGDDRLAWRRPAEKVVETSRNKQRDFYLLTEIELPPTLSIGSYQLKVIIRDEVGNSRAESSIPIGIVADPALAWQQP